MREEVDGGGHLQQNAGLGCDLATLYMCDICYEGDGEDHQLHVKHGDRQRGEVPHSGSRSEIRKSCK